MNCVHHWIIEATTAPTAWAECKKCGEVAHFDNGRSKDLTRHESNSLMYPSQASKDIAIDFHALGFAQHDRGSRIR